MSGADHHFAGGLKLFLFLPILTRRSSQRQITVSRNAAQFGNVLSEIETIANNLQRFNDRSSMFARSTFPDRSLMISGRPAYLPVATPS